MVYMISDFSSYSDYLQYLESSLKSNINVDQVLDLVKFKYIDKDTSMPTYVPYSESEFNQIKNK